MTSEYKEASEAVTYSIESGVSLTEPLVTEHAKTIRKALKIAEAVSGFAEELKDASRFGGVVQVERCEKATQQLIKEVSE